MRRNKLLKIYYPHPKFPAVSISGAKCALKCRHCNGIYLENMLCADTPEKFIAVCKKVASDGGTGILVSGGFDKDGKLLNLSDEMIRALKKIKNETALTINIHSGFVEENTLRKLAKCVDVASVDVAGTQQIKDVFRLGKTPSDYLENIKLIKKYGIECVPHLCVGFDEIYSCMDSMREIAPKIIVFTGFRQTKNTDYENFEEPKPEDWHDIIAYARKLFPKTELALGCMRSRKNRTKIESAAMEAGIDRIVLPSKETLALAHENNYYMIILETCCAVL